VTFYMRLLLIEQTKQQQTFEHMIHIDNQYVKRTLVFTAVQLYTRPISEAILRSGCLLL